MKPRKAKLAIPLNRNCQKLAHERLGGHQDAFESEEDESLTDGEPEVETLEVDVTPHVAVQPPTPVPTRAASEQGEYDGNQFQPFRAIAAVPKRQRSSLKVKRSKDDSEGEENESRSYIKSKLWWAGILLMALGEGGNFLSYGFAPASVVAPLGTVGECTSLGKISPCTNITGSPGRQLLLRPLDAQGKVQPKGPPRCRTSHSWSSHRRPLRQELRPKRHSSLSFACHPTTDLYRLFRRNPCGCDGSARFNA